MIEAQLIRWLHSSLSKKTEGYNQRQDPAIRAIFLLNNVNYLLKRLEKFVKLFAKLINMSNQVCVDFRSPLLVIIQRCQPDLKSKYDADFEISLKDYTRW